MKIRKVYITFLLTFIIAQLSANKLAMAYQALSIHDYFKARALFYSLNKKTYNPHSAYGLAIIYYRDNNPFHNYDSASKYANISLNLYHTNPLIDTLSGFIINKSTYQALVDSIAFKQLKMCDLNSSIKVYDLFLKNNYLASKTYISQALQRRDQLEFNNIIHVNKSDSTHLFIITHPLSSFKAEASRLMERQVYEEITVAKTELSYIQFISQYPKNSYVNAAYRSLLNLYNDTKNKTGIANFIINYPNAPQLMEAWQLLFTLSVKTFTKEELESFIATYSNFPFKASILKELQLNDLVLIPVQKNDRIGFADTTGKIAIEPSYDEVSDFKEGLSIVHKNDSVFFVNKENTNTIKRVFSDALPFNNGLAPVKIDTKWYLIDRLGDQKTQGFEEMNDLSEGLYIIKQNNFYGSMDEFGQIVNEAKFEKMGDFKNACAYYQLEGKYGFISKSGYVHKPEFEWISDFNALGIAIYKKENKFGLIKNNGQPIAAALYDQIIPCPGNIYIVVINNNYGYYSADACFLSEVIYDYEKERKPTDYTNGSALKLIKKKQEALIDLNGRTSIDFGTFSEVHFASNGLIRVKKNSKYGFVDRKLNSIIACKYLTAEDFIDSVAIVTSKKGYILINTNGDELLSSENKIERICNHYFLVEGEDSTKLYNSKGLDVLSQVASVEIYKHYLIVYLQNNEIKIIRI